MDDRISTFLGRVAPVKQSKPTVRTLCQEEWQAIDSQYRTEDSRRVRVTAYRKAMKEAGLPKYVWSMLRMPKVRARALRPLYDAKVADKSSNQQPIHHYQALVEKALDCLTSRSYATVMVGLCLLSGRRPIEICMTGDFCEDASLPERHVWFSGQAKTRDDELAQAPFAIPLLCDVPTFIDAWTRFLDMKDFRGYEGERFKSLGKTFGEAYARHFAALMPPDTSVRHLRDAYGLIAYHTCRPAHPHIAINLYLKKILGHSDSKGQTAQSYQKFYLAEFANPQWEN
jgi:Telomere resolvase ResT/TelK catalytic domain